MTHSTKAIVVEKNRKWALWSLAIILGFVPISLWLVTLGLQPGRPDVSWSLVLFGVLGVVAFGGSAILILRTVRAPWHLELDPAHLELVTPTYDLMVPWESVIGIAVHKVNRRPGCVLVFDDVAAVSAGARFHHSSSRPDAVTNARTMQARMEENFDLWGYHFGIPGRILEMGPEELAGLLARARTGKLWKGEAKS